MSRIGKKPIQIPAGVDVKITGQEVRVKGPKGELSVSINPVVSVSVIETEKGKEIVFDVKKNFDEKYNRAQWGTARALVANMVKGVTERFVKHLEVNGVGYRVNISGRKLILNVGFSHDVIFELPQGIEAQVDGNIVTITGIDRHLVGELADNIRRVYVPEPYKGKGIRYTTEVVRRKAGKTQKAGE